MVEIRLIIDGLEVTVPQGATILDAARKAGSYVPALCHHPDLKPIGSCKLCIVSVVGFDHYPASCNTLAEEGMVVETRTEELQEMRRHTWRCSWPSPIIPPPAFFAREKTNAPTCASA